MFHVKRRQTKNASPITRVSSDSDEIGRRTRILVEESLNSLGFSPEQPIFFDRVERFAAALALWGSRVNLTARPDDPSEIAFHIIDSLAPQIIADRPDGAMLESVFTVGRRVLDLGSGAGFPGLILAAGCEADFTLLESRRRRASFLTAAIAAMDIHNAVVSTGRAETSAQSPMYDAVTARAFAEPFVVYESAAAALKAGGVAILYANPSQDIQEDRASVFGLADQAKIAYEVARGRQKVPRILVIWRKS